MNVRMLRGGESGKRNGEETEDGDDKETRGVGGEKRKELASVEEG